MYLVVLDERLARVGNLAHPLEADTGRSLLTTRLSCIQKPWGWSCSSESTELVAPQAVALVVVDVGVSDLNFRDGLQARTNEPEEVRILGGIAQLYTVERAVGVGDASPLITRSQCTA